MIETALSISIFNLNVIFYEATINAKLNCCYGWISQGSIWNNCISSTQPLKFLSIWCKLRTHNNLRQLTIDIFFHLVLKLAIQLREGISHTFSCFGWVYKGQKPHKYGVDQRSGHLPLRLNYQARAVSLLHVYILRFKAKSNTCIYFTCFRE